MAFAAQSPHPLQTNITAFAKTLVDGEAGQQFLVSISLICCVDALHALLQQHELTLSGLLSDEILDSPGSPDTLNKQSESKQVAGVLEALKQGNGDPDLAIRAETAVLEAIRSFLTEPGNTSSPRATASSPPVTPIAAAGSRAGGMTPRTGASNVPLPS